MKGETRETGKAKDLPAGKKSGSIRGGATGGNNAESRTKAP